MSDNVHHEPIVDTRRALEIGRRLEAVRIIREASNGLALLGLPYVRLAKQLRAVASLVAEGSMPTDVLKVDIPRDGGNGADGPDGPS